MTTIAEYTRGYNNGRIDKTKGLPMNMPNAVSNT